MLRVRQLLLLAATTLLYAAPTEGSAALCVAENDLTGRGGEDPPPMGDLVRVVNGSVAGREVVGTGMQDPVWVVACPQTPCSDVDFAYVGLFHAGQVSTLLPSPASYM
jgi:hypothetical protein